MSRKDKAIFTNFQSTYWLLTLGVLIFGGTNFRELLFLQKFEVQFFVFGLLSLEKNREIREIRES